MIGGAEQGLAAIDAVDQHAEARAALRRRERRPATARTLNGADALARGAGLVGHRLQLRAMVDRERHEPVGRRAGASSPSGCG